MKRSTIFILMLGMSLIYTTPILMGVDGCNDGPVAEPGPEPNPLTADELKMILEGVLLTEKGIVDAAMAGENPDFDACMIATGTMCGIQGAIDSVDAIAAEMEAPDGKLTISGCKFDATEATGTGCEKIKPEPWPVVDPAGWSTEAKLYANVAFNATEMVIVNTIPAEGKKCVDGHVVLGSVQASHQLTDNVFDQAVQGSFTLDIPSADINYSMCGMDVVAEEPVDEPVEEPAADDDSAE